jgi:hypothetical protein
MRSRLAGLILALLTGHALSSRILAQTAERLGAAKAQAAAPAPDLSGLWSRLRDAAVPRGYELLVLEFSRAEPPMTPWAEAKYKAAKPLYRGSEPGTALSDPIFSCFPPGVPRILLFNFPVQIVQIPGQVIMLFEFNHFVRRIYTDGRPHDKELGPLWMGDSIGRWEGDTLVADTVSFNDKTLLDQVGHPHSDQLHVVERIRRVDHDSLEIEVMIDDPKAYTKPWGTKLIYQLRPDWNVTEHVCEDNVTFLDFNNKAIAEPTK